jgi:hypothetical protein
MPDRFSLSKREAPGVSRRGAHYSVIPDSFRRIEKLEEQLLEAKQKLEGTPRDAPAPDSRSPEARHRPSVVEEDFSTFQFASFFEDLEPITLDGITIQPQTTVELFER